MLSGTLFQLSNGK